MKRVLICKSLMEDLQYEISQCITTSLLEKECIIETFTPKDVRNIPPQVIFDIIIAFNKDALIAVTSLTHNKEIPIIYVFHNIEENLVWNYPRVIKNFIIDIPRSQLPEYIAQNKDYYSVPSLFELKDLRKHQLYKLNLEELHILFHVNDKILLSIVPEINRIVHYKTTIICDNCSLFRSMLNSTIRVIESDKTALSELIAKTDIFIGEKLMAALSIFMCKPTIIVGEEGYGGLISPLNIHLQTLNGFKGRIGGYKNEYIPVNLVIQNIDSCAQKIQSKKHHDILFNISNILYDINKSNINTISDYLVNHLLSIDKFHKEKLLIWNNNYRITAISGNRYLITDAIIYKHVAILSKKEYYYVNQFSKPQTFNQILNLINILPANEVEKLLIELLNNRILKTVD